MGLDKDIQLVSGETESVAISLKNLIMMGKDAVSGGGGLYPIESYRYELENVIQALEKHEKENLLASLIKIMLRNKSEWEKDSWFFQSINQIDKYNKENDFPNQVYWNDLVKEAYGMGYIKNLRGSAEFFIKEWSAIEDLMPYSQHFTKLRVESFAQKIEEDGSPRGASIIQNSKLLVGLISVINDLKNVGLDIDVDKQEVSDFLSEKLLEVNDLYSAENSSYEMYGNYINLVKKMIPQDLVNQSCVQVFLSSQKNYKNANYLIRNLKDFFRSASELTFENVMDLELDSCMQWKSVRNENNSYVIEFHHANIAKSLYLESNLESTVKEKVGLRLPDELEVYRNESQGWVVPKYKKKIAEDIKNSLRNAGLVSLSEDIAFPNFDETSAGKLSYPDANIIFKVSDNPENREVLDLVSQVYMAIAMGDEEEENIYLEKFEVILLEHQMKKDISKKEENKTLRVRKF